MPEPRVVLCWRCRGYGVVFAWRFPSYRRKCSVCDGFGERYVPPVPVEDET